MTTPTSSLGMSHIQTEFGGSNPISLSEYYGVHANVPASGTISMSQFLGITSFSNTTYDYTTAATSTVSVPSGAVNLIIEVWGAGGGGMGWSDDGYADSQGGGAGGYSKRTVALSGDSGKSISYTVGAGGAAGTNAGAGAVGGAGANGVNSTCTGSTLTNSFDMAGNGGKGGKGGTGPYTNWTGGQGGTATGGTTNTTGASTNQTYATGVNSGGAATVGDDSASAGAGGRGWTYDPQVNQVAGAVGRVKLRFTT